MLDIHQIRTESDMGNVVRKIKDFKMLLFKELKNFKSFLANGIKTIINLAKERFGFSAKQRVSTKYIVTGVCDFYKISEDDLKKHSRKPDVIERRRLTCLLLRIYTKNNLKSIAISLGYVNHATVLHHIKKAKNFLSNELYSCEETKITYKKLLNHLKL